jgi:hypothetical protein
MSTDGRELLCRFNPPTGHPIISVVGEPPAPQFLGTISVWPQVQADHWCGHHKREVIQQAHEIPKQLQTFGVS